MAQFNRDDPAQLGMVVAQMVKGAGAPMTAENFNRAMSAILAGETTTEFEKGGDAGGGRRGGRSAPPLLERALERTTSDNAVNGVRISAGDPSTAVQSGVDTAGVRAGAMGPESLAVEAASAPQVADSPPVQVPPGGQGGPISESTMQRMLGPAVSPGTEAPSIPTDRPAGDAGAEMRTDQPTGTAGARTEGSQVRQSVSSMLREYADPDVLANDPTVRTITKAMMGSRAPVPVASAGTAIAPAATPFANLPPITLATPPTAGAGGAAVPLALPRAAANAYGTRGTPAQNAADFAHRQAMGRQTRPLLTNDIPLNAKMRDYIMQRQRAEILRRMVETGGTGGRVP
jgi:hypothetical protein